MKGPSYTDKQKIDSVLGYGWAENITSSVISNNIARFTSKDRSYGEKHYRVQLQRYSSGSWKTVATQNVINNTGLVKGLGWTYDRTVTADFYLTSYGSGTYRVAIAPYFQSYNKYGGTYYSSSIVY
ncbi:hypothetical protein [Lederbergia graminis]|uniref:Uncharacterized protein n=1 Tax=Lederbergia graminis TaxID=735518 RepID=A0ABW0LF24_9BACI